MNTPFEFNDHPDPPRRPGIFARLRSSFLTGLVVIAPVGLTIWLIWTVIGWVDSFVLPFIPQAYQPDVVLRALIGDELYARWLGDDTQLHIRGVGVVIFLLFTIVVGWLAKGFIGRSLIRWAEGLVDRMPVVRSVYNGVKQLAETVFAQSESSFEKACLIQYPRKGIWAIGFISTTARGEIAGRAETSGGLLSVFVPTTPNPTSGFLLFFPQEDVIELDMTVEDAAKLVISAGLVYPNPKDPTKPAKQG
ncbi:Uncharacterized membrane protein [Lutimaribacter pacificus]|uniref:Uncharacterized membrane protein n=1 Tax=Lutimaribacter pacificus TaxID=391948 RepID=A0A1H0A843_9RHOB|nr:DUF502 domain-containing protein [Lutimaribacter pacificus]SDN29798.1 Uncharacterized membrane protein [Lutimaribacter pacificus]SHJ72158.1 Uncharacterized membrane protein [Lutimaribacter pacificus]